MTNRVVKLDDIYPNTEQWIRIASIQHVRIKYKLPLRLMIEIRLRQK